MPRLPLDQEHRALIAQLARYGVTGLVVTAIAAGVYWVAATPLAVRPAIAAAIGYLVAVVLGYTLHSRYSFRGHGRRDSPVRATVRFVLVSLLSLALNELWVWLLVARLGGPTWWPIPLMVFVTPLATFALNRRWVFA